MTSKNLFFKLIRQDIKKRIWFPILIFIVCFLALEVHMLMVIEEIIKYPNRYGYDAEYYVANCIFGSYISSAAIIVCITAFLSALSGYAYLHSRTQLDTYHSIPVSRGELFWSKYISGILQFFVPFVFHVLICVCIAASKRVYSMEVLVHSFGFIGTELLIFVLTYSASIAAVCVTGNIIISVLGMGVFFCASSLISLLREGLFERFFSTYISFGYEEKFTFSPLGMLIKLGNKIDDCFKANGIMEYSDIWEYLWLFIPMTAVYAVIAFGLYTKRPSEAAGKAIAFGAAEPIIKAVIVIPAALYSGLFFEDVSSSSNSFGWFLFGAVFGFVILCLLIEIIFRMDIRGVLCHKKQFVFNAACVALIIMIFKNDVLGFNTYVPLDAQLQSCAVSVNGLLDVSLEIRNNNNLYGYNSYTYISAEQYRMETMQIQGNPSVMELARKAAKEGLQYAEIDYYDGIEESAEYQEIMEQQKGYCDITFGYQLLNGKEVYRTYVIDITDSETFKLLNEVFQDYDYKIGSSPILNNGWSTEYAEIQCRNNFSSGTVELTPGKQAKLLETYQAEYMKLILDDVMNTIPVGSICFLTKEEAEEYYRYGYYGSEYLIYPQFTSTIALIEEYGFDFYEKVTADDISEIVVYDYRTQNNEAVTYTDQKEIEQLLDCIVCGAFRSGNSICSQNLYDTDFGIGVVGGKLESDYMFRFKKDMVPDFVLNNLK